MTEISESDKARLVGLLDTIESAVARWRSYGADDKMIAGDIASFLRTHYDEPDTAFAMIWFRVMGTLEPAFLDELDTALSAQYEDEDE